MKNWFKRVAQDGINSEKRRTLGKLVAGSGLLVLGVNARAEQSSENEMKFPGDEPDHKVVYQFNQGDHDYHKAVLFSVGAMLRKYGDNIKIVVTCFGPGLHILAKNPTRPVDPETRERVSSLSDYGIEFHACGNTMKALHWTEKDMLPFAKVVEVGASDLMELQEQGYSYISW